MDNLQVVGFGRDVDVAGHERHGRMRVTVNGAGPTISVRSPADGILGRGPIHQRGVVVEEIGLLALFNLEIQADEVKDILEGAHPFHLHRRLELGVNLIVVTRSQNHGEVAR